MSSVLLLVRFFPTGLMLALICTFSYGQPVEEFRKLWQDKGFGYIFSNQRDKLYSGTDFYNYARIRDEDFSEYLKETWVDYSIFAPLSEETRNTMIKKPVFNYSDLDITYPVNLPYSGVVGFNDIGTGQISSMHRIRKPETDEFNSINEKFLFYGQQINLHCDKLLTISATATVSEDSVSGFWKSFSSSNSNHLVDQLMDYRDLLGLGDWGFFQLVKAASSHIYRDNIWKADQLTWALMIRSGFDVRLAFNQNSTTILFTSENNIYARQFVMIGQKRFYLDREMNSQLLVTCQDPFPDTDGMIDVKFYKSLNFSGKLIIRKFSLQWNNKKYEFALRYNPSVIRFYHDYPKTDQSVFFGASVSSTLKEDLLGQFYPVLSKMGKVEAVAFLQQFLQRQFDYSTLNAKSGLAQSRFAEEIIASKSGDDRSKAVLFSWLIRILLRYPVVGVQTAGYYSAAVCFDEPIDGDFYFLNRRKYIITDPTILNAPIGLMMHELSGLVTQLIDLPAPGSQPDNAREIWKLAVKMGASRGGECQDNIVDRQGRTLITGYFAGKRSNNPFIACFSEGNSLQWIRKFDSDGKAAAYAITKANDDEIYIAGSFSGKMEMDGKSIQSNNRNGNLFIAQLNQNGDLVWIRNVAIDSTVRNEQVAYLVKFNRTGDIVSIQSNNEDGRNIHTGFGYVSETGLCFTGTGNLVSNIIHLSLTAGKTDILGVLFKEYNYLIGKRCHPKVAGLISIMKFLLKPGMEVTGKQIQTFVNCVNKSVSVEAPSLLKTLGQIGKLKNENGIVSLKTIDNKPLIFDKLRLEDGAKFNISVFDNGDLSIGIISGFQMVVYQVVLYLNSLLIDYSSGNLMLDYDSDHTLKTVSSGALF